MDKVEKDAHLDDTETWVDLCKFYVRCPGGWDEEEEEKEEEEEEEHECGRN